nr:immunoglobulin heavy chain junction region [Macaca mulatta]
CANVVVVSATTAVVDPFGSW